VVQAPLDVDLDMDKEAIVTIGSKEGLAHLMLATLDRGRHGAGAEPELSRSTSTARSSPGADIRSVRMTPGVDFFAEAERAIGELIPKPKMMILGFPRIRPRAASSSTSSSA
jgi:alanine-synthesizing transaminase